VGTTMSHNHLGLHGLLQGYLYLYLQEEFPHTSSAAVKELLSFPSIYICVKQHFSSNREMKYKNLSLMQNITENMALQNCT
jgi:hypothetical protein